MFVTAKLLREHGACTREVRAFRRHWPHGCKVLRKNLEIAQKAGLDLCWFGAMCFSGRARGAFRRKYSKACLAQDVAYGHANAVGREIDRVFNAAIIDAILAAVAVSDKEQAMTDCKSVWPKAVPVGEPGHGAFETTRWRGARKRGNRTGAAEPRDKGTRSAAVRAEGRHHASAFLAAGGMHGMRPDSVPFCALPSHGVLATPPW